MIAKRVGVSAICERVKHAPNKGYLVEIEWCIQHGLQIDKSDMSKYMTVAAFYGSVSLMEHLLLLGGKWTSEYIVIAMRKYRLDFCRWAQCKGLAINGAEITSLRGLQGAAPLPLLQWALTIPGVAIDELYVHEVTNHQLQNDKRVWSLLM